MYVIKSIYNIILVGTSKEIKRKQIPTSLLINDEVTTQPKRSIFPFIKKGEGLASIFHFI